MIHKQVHKRMRSQASLAIVVAISIIFLSIAIEVSTISYTHIQNQIAAQTANSAFLIVDSSTEEALYRLYLDSSYSGSTYADPFSGDNATISVNVDTPTQRTVSISANYSNLHRNLSAVVSLTPPGGTGGTNPLADYVIFSSENMIIDAATGGVLGDIWTNDNVEVTNGSIVAGNIYASGQGAISSSRVRYNGMVIDNPYTAGVTEGNISAIDRIRVTNSGIVQGTARSATGVTVSTGGSVGSSVYDSHLTLDSIPIPVFDYDTYRTQAQAAGTYYASPAAFLSYLSLNGNSIGSGVHFIDSTSTLVIPSGTYNITGSIISLGTIDINATNYVQTSGSDLPAIVSQNSIYVRDQSSCNCAVQITGLLFADTGDITLDFDQYTGSQQYAAIVTGGLWAGDQVFISDKSVVYYNQSIIANVEGFNFDGGGGGTTYNNVVTVNSWNID